MGVFVLFPWHLKVCSYCQ